MTGDDVQIGGAIGNVNRNAPSVILTFLSTFSVLGMLGAILLIAQPLLRDSDLRTDELFFSTPVSKGSYLWGRALGGAIAAFGVFVVRRARHGDRLVHAVAGSEAHRSVHDRAVRVGVRRADRAEPDLRRRAHVPARRHDAAPARRVPRRDGAAGRVPDRRRVAERYPVRHDRAPDRSVRRTPDGASHALLVGDRTQHAAAGRERAVAAQSRDLARRFRRDAGCRASAVSHAATGIAQACSARGERADPKLPRPRELHHCVAHRRRSARLRWHRRASAVPASTAVRRRQRAEEPAVPDPAGARPGQLHQQRARCRIGCSAPTSIRSPR